MITMILLHDADLLIAVNVIELTSYVNVNIFTGIDDESFLLDRNWTKVSNIV